MNAFLNGNFVNGLSAWLADFYLLATLVLATSLVARLVIRPPGSRVAMAWGTWLGVAAIAVLSALPAWPRYTVDELAAVWQSQPQDDSATPLDVAFAEPIAIDTELGHEPIALDFAFPVESEALVSDPPAPSWTWSQAGAVVWLASVALALGWMILGAARARRLLSRASKVSQWVQNELRRIVTADHVRALPGVWTSREVTTAVALCAIRPQIVLPQSCADEANAPAVRAALAHEWAHIRHGDLWLLALERLLLPLLAVHPLFWWLRRSVRLDQELLADAAAAGQQPVEYAEALLSWAKSARPARHGLAALAMWENPNTLSRRVSMILDPKVPAARPVHRGWLLLLLVAVLPASVGLSLVTLRPLTAQEKAAEESPPQPSPFAPPGAVPSQPPKVFNQVPATQQTVPVTKIQMELLLLSVDREQLAAADTSLEDAIQSATESRCRREAGLIVADVVETEVKSLLDALKAKDAVKVVSRPSIVTLDGREATVHVGGEAPILRVEETINGKHERRVEYKEFGTMLMVRPKLDADEKEEFVRLDIVAEQASLLPPGEAVEGAVPRDVPGLVSHKFKLTADVKLGGSLLVAESPADKKQLRAGVKEQFVVIVTPTRAVREAVAVYANPQEGEKAEAARAAAAAVPETATAAEPASGTAAAALLARERELRAQETAELRKQIEALTTDLAKLRAATGHDIITTVFKVRQRRPESIAADLQALFSATPAKNRIDIVVEAANGSIIIRADKPLMLECEKLVVALDRPSGDVDPKDPNAETVRRVWGLLAERRQATSNPPMVLKDDVQYLPPAPERSPQELQSRVFRLRKGDAYDHKIRFDELLAKSPLATQKIAVNFKGEFAEVHAPAELIGEVRKLLEPLGVEEITAARATEKPAAAPGPPTRAVDQQLFELDLRAAELALEKAEKDYGRIEQLARDGQISQEQVDAARYALAMAKIEVQRAKAKLQAASQTVATSAAAEPAQSEKAPPSKAAEVKLLELDLAEAKLAVEVAEAELEMADQVRKKNPGAISEPEIRKHQFQVDRAKIQLQRIMIKLEATKSETKPERK